MELNRFAESAQQASAQGINAVLSSKSTDFRAAGFMTFMAVSCLLTPVANAGSVGYSPEGDTTQTVEQGGDSLPFTFRAESPKLPATGKPKQTPYQTRVCAGEPGVAVEYIAKDMSFSYSDPATLELVTIPFDFTEWLSLDPLVECFDGPRVGEPVSTIVSVPTDARVGMYTAKLVAKGPMGIGWGEGAGMHITVNVIEPTAIDSTPPVVTIIEPALDNSAPQSFTLGDRIPVDFTAVDLESPITAWTATLMQGPVNLSSLMVESSVVDGIEASGFILSAVPGGTETIQAIGPYSLQATATSDGGTSAPTSRSFTVNYAMSPKAPDLTSGSLTISKRFNSQGKCTGGDLQVKFSASAVQPADTANTDNSLEAFVHDESVIVEILDEIENTLLLERTYGTDNKTQVTISGSTGDADAEYFTKVDLCSTPNGEYAINVYFDDHSGEAYLQYTKAFTLQD
ncbi:hypothetical protein GCM10011348_42980 [Marinobacterium nitratireducens]|uniref:Uncharacterized protein n=1 Tax=Marinobacterium nitratireducens TaxID=518897 RepID=A0A917ZRG1_9GAMM|nr:hypothetical protein [Marinobacterium nitratireducens]GGO88148.1 hypothetical protein GCM10011348_42980 [Marinobacterium nitratireducens]